MIRTCIDVIRRPRFRRALTLVAMTVLLVSGCDAASGTGADNALGDQLVGFVRAFILQLAAAFVI